MALISDLNETGVTRRSSPPNKIPFRFSPSVPTPNATLQYSRAVNNEVEERTAISIKIFGQITAPPHCAQFLVITRRKDDHVFVPALEEKERKSRLVSNDPPTHLHARLFPWRSHNGKAYVNSSLQEEHFSLPLHSGYCVFGEDPQRHNQPREGPSWSVPH